MMVEAIEILESARFGSASGAERADASRRAGEILVRIPRRMNVKLDDALVDSLLLAARHWVEQATGLRLITQTLVARFDACPADGAPLLLPITPVASVVSVVSYDTSNAATTLTAAAYLADTTSAPPRIALNSGSAWPSALRAVNALEVTCVAGYGASGASVPQPILHALLMLMAFLYDQRSAIGVDPGLTIAEMPFGPRALLGPYKVWWL